MTMEILRGKNCEKQIKVIALEETSQLPHVS